jgi:hypothetical protein
MQNDEIVLIKSSLKKKNHVKKEKKLFCIEIYWNKNKRSFTHEIENKLTHTHIQPKYFTSFATTRNNNIN